MARLKEAARKFAHDRNVSSPSQSLVRSHSSPPAPTPPNHSDSESSSKTSFKSISDHDDDFEIQSIPLTQPETVQNPVESQTQISSDPSQNISPENIVTPTPTIPVPIIAETPPVLSKHKKSKSMDSTKIRRSDRIRSSAGRKPVIDKTIYTITDSDSENTLSDSPTAKSAPIIKTYSRKPSSSKSKSKIAKESEPSSEEKDDLLKDSLPKNLILPIPLVHKDGQGSFEKFWKNKPVIPGRVYNFDDLMTSGVNLTEYTEPLGWTTFFNIKETHYPGLISAFYFNAVVHSDKSMITSHLKGVKVKVTVELLGELLYLPIEGHRVYGSNWFTMLEVGRMELMAQMFEAGTNLKDPPSSKLQPEYKLLHNMCLHSIFPRKGSKEKVTDNDMMIMYHMFNKIKLNLPYVMLQHMIYAIESGAKKITLPYGMFLTRIFRHFKVNVKGEEVKNTFTVFSSKNVGRMKKIADIEDQATDDQGLKRKREEFEKESNLEVLANAVTKQSDRSENILPATATSARGKSSCRR